jgi:phytoene dehydrogenase-like protein
VIAVVGGGLAGLAAAARLARVGHDVVVFEARPRVGVGADAATEPGGEVFTLPAAWRDLFTKSGRKLEAELALRGLSLVPAGPRAHRFADGSTLDLPNERGEQWTAIRAALGEDAAVAWRDLLDGLDGTWQRWRQLSLETEPDQRLLRTAARSLLPSGSMAELAGRLAAPELGEIILATAAWLGQEPRRLPGWHAFRLALERTFGRWQVVGTDGLARPASILVDLLVERLQARGVDLRTGIEVAGIRRGPVLQAAGVELPVAAVISTVDPFTHADLTHERADQRIAARLHRCAGPGPAWTGWRTVLDLPTLQPSLPGVLVASAWSVGGPDPWAQLLTGALAAYRVHADLTGEDIRPSNKLIGPNGRPRPVRDRADGRG